MGVAEIVIVGIVGLCFLVIGLLVVWVVYRRHDRQAVSQDFGEAEGDYDRDLLRSELRDKAREDLARAIEENVDFIKQDVRRSTSELNGYMQQEVTRALNEEIARFAKSTDNLEGVASSSISRMQSLLNERYMQLSARVDEESAGEKQRIIENFENNMTEVVAHYVTQALGQHLDVDSQLDYIIGELDRNKQMIVGDIRGN